MTKAVEIKNLSVLYDKTVRAVDQLSLEVEEGEFFGLLGPNGAGKTSVISSMTGLLDVRYGKILIFGHPAGSIEAKRLMGVVPQESVHHGFFSVEEILKFFSGYYGIWNNKKRIEYLLERLQLSEHRKKQVSQLSGGMKRRLLIAKALIHSPKLLLLDEPSAGVDIELRALLWEFMKDLNRQGTSILLTTHYLEEAERLCHRLAIMDQGRILALDSTRQLISSRTERQIQIRLGSPVHLNSGSIPGVLKVEREGDWLRFTCLGDVSVGEILKNIGVPLQNIKDIQVQEGALETAFLRILKGDVDVVR